MSGCDGWESAGSGSKNFWRFINFATAAHAWEYYWTRKKHRCGRGVEPSVKFTRSSSTSREIGHWSSLSDFKKLTKNSVFWANFFDQELLNTIEEALSSPERRKTMSNDFESSTKKQTLIWPTYTQKKNLVSGKWHFTPSLIVPATLPFI